MGFLSDRSFDCEPLSRDTRGCPKHLNGVRLQGRDGAPNACCCRGASARFAARTQLLGLIPVRRAILVTGHYALSKRRAGFHWIAEAFTVSGWHVTFITVGFSQLSRLKVDHRFQYGFPGGANRVLEVDAHLDSYVWFTPYHPLNRLPALGNLLLGYLFRGYGRLPMAGVEQAIAGADLIVFESTSGLMLVDRFRAWAPQARMVYRVSDDLRLLRAHPVVLEADRRALPTLDLVSVPNDYIKQGFLGHPNVELHPHGIDTSLFDAPSTNPFDTSVSCHAVFVGTSHLDRVFIDTAVRQFPDWQFHVIGPLGDIPTHPNLRVYGELPFGATVPFIAHADIGLATRSYAPGAESLADSLKVVQYTYAGLPIVAPDFMKSRRNNVFLYKPGDPESINSALKAARAMDRSTVDRGGIWSWSDLAKAVAGPDLWP